MTRTTNSWLDPALQAILLALFFFSALSIPIDDGLWMTLAQGRETGAGANEAWLGARAWFALWGVGGPAALVAARALLATAAMGLLLALFGARGLRSGPGPVAALGAAMIAWHHANPARLQPISVTLLAVWLFWLTRQHQGTARLPWAMVPLAALWANLESGVVLGLLLFLPFLLADALTLAGQLEGDQAGAGRRLGRTTVLLLACTAATLANPAGLAALAEGLQDPAPLGCLTALDWFTPARIGQRPLLEAVLLGIVALAMVSPRKLTLPDALLGTWGVHLVLTDAGGPALLGPLLAPAVAEHLDLLLVRVAEPREDSGGAPYSLQSTAYSLRAGGARAVHLASARWIRRPESLAVTVALLAAALGFQGWSTARAQLPPPAKAVEWLRAHRPPGRLFNSADFGGYLTFHLPEYAVFVDPRIRLHYRQQRLQEYLQLVQLHPHWQELFDARGIGLVMVEPGKSLASLLAGHPGWLETHRDEQAVIFLRR